MIEHDNLNILFISPSTMPLFEQEQLLGHSNKNLTPKFETPTGLIELASYTRNKFDFAKFEMLDLAKDLFLFKRNYAETAPITTDEFYNQHLDTIEYIPDIVGISVLFSSSYMSTLKLSGLIKKKWPNTKVVIGGGHPTFFHAKAFEDSPDIDFVFIGEAELAFGTFVERCYGLKTGELDEVRIDDIQGLYDRAKVESDAQKGITSAVFGETLVDLDEIGLPAYDLMDLETYRNLSNANAKGAVGVMMERGCPFSCTYCASMVIHGGRIRTKSNDRIIADLRYLRDDCGFETIILWDDLLAARKTKFTALVKQILEEKVNEGLTFTMPSGLSVRVMDNDLIETICSLGFDYIRIMIESGSEDAQENIVKKKVNLDKARSLIAHARTQDVKVETNILFGFPGETRAHMQETIDYIKTIDVDWIQVFSLLPLPGTEAFYGFVQMGKLDPQNIDWDRCGYAAREFDTEEISAQALTELVYDVNIFTNFFGNRNMLQGRYQRAADYFSSMVLRNYDFHVPALYMRSQAYAKLGNEEKAQQDLDQAVEQIKTSEIARGLWERYGSKMPELKEIVPKEFHANVADHPPSVRNGFVF